MSMPKGHKSENGYATVSGDVGGMDYRKIAETMTEQGFKMNHATARNIFLRGMRKLAEPICELYDMDATQESLDRATKDPRFQTGMVEILTGVYESGEPLDGEIDV
jgi:transcription antitermination factor NusG